MLDTSKFYDFFQPEKCVGRIHIIGCGSVGSTIAELMARLDLTNFVLYDFDIVEPHNIANQIFGAAAIGKQKTEALRDILAYINPDLGNARIEASGYTGQSLDGYVFLCVDNIELRHSIASACRMNPNIKAMFDVRTRLTDAQHYAARWDSMKEVKSFIASMDFTQAEADANTPVSACNTALSVAPTVRMICNCAVANFMNYITTGQLKTFIPVDAFKFYLEAFPVTP